MLDPFETDASTVAWLKREGKCAICYLNAGAWEDWRPDAERYPQRSWERTSRTGPGNAGSTSGAWISSFPSGWIASISVLPKLSRPRSRQSQRLSKRHRISPLRRSSANRRKRSPPTSTGSSLKVAS
ncbi:endo alpha-1,4 polygalactosaminidase [Hydrogenibacillus schlegelii]|uniref:endo alpha-1,4 polygalactosaminidase n=1 Tax=Hydrogenibacillus schlegelii TaxID=1484 RepID=UPI0034A020C7